MKKFFLTVILWIFGFPIFSGIIGLFWNSEETLQDGTVTTVPSGGAFFLGLVLTIYLTTRIFKKSPSLKDFSGKAEVRDTVDFGEVVELKNINDLKRERRSELGFWERLFGPSSSTVEKWKSEALQKQEKVDLERLKHLIDIHEDALVRNWHKYVEVDDYGAKHYSDWYKEIRRFLLSTNFSSLVIDEDLLLLVVSDMVEERLEGDEGYSVFDYEEIKNAYEFEEKCAEELSRLGWNTVVTASSGDQGVDVIASKSGTKVVLQCKLYSSPVGNKAVQEAIAGMAYENADRAVVVATSGFTSSAIALAKRANVLLLSPKELKSLDRHLNV